MASTIKVDKLDPQSGTALEIGTSGDTVTVPSGVGLTLTDSTLLLPTTITSTTEVKTNKISPATGTAFALGDSGDTFTVPSGATIVNSGTATGFGGGVIQTEFYSLTTTLTATNTTFADLGNFSIDITPTSASNKIKLSIFFGSCNGGSANNTIGFLYTRDGTEIGIGTAAGSKVGASFRVGQPPDLSHGNIVSHSCIDAPATTSQITYKIQNRNETGTLYINRAPAQTDNSEIYNAIFSSIFIAEEITP